MWTQNQILLTAKSRGFHLITTEIIDALPILNTIECGLLHLFVKQTSASLIINENANPAANQEFVMPFDESEPEKSPYDQYDYDKNDKMSIYLKNCLLGSSVSIPITHGELNLGIWQGIYLYEHHKLGAKRSLVATILGQSMPLKNSA
ncbi:secondary thiamine-phosphate synthase enzyme YjbQ [Crenothrix sp.]|uniref:secondary thiamine-phosphate synthase enzyme YjbQ n=1 Tax=Crenothrix sp. TaxID=3100433 RepID=UPI00374D1739